MKRSVPFVGIGVIWIGRGGQKLVVEDQRFVRVLALIGTLVLMLRCEFSGKRRRRNFWILLCISSILCYF